MRDWLSSPDGRNDLLTALRRQHLLTCHEDAALWLVDRVVLQHCHPGDALITEGDYSTDVFFILAGSFSIVIKGTLVNVRMGGASVGEMAAIEPCTPRSASVIGREEGVVARLAGSHFHELLAGHPVLWQSIARDLAERLRQRSGHVRRRNDVARVFLGSSRESAPVAHKLQGLLVEGKVQVAQWDLNVFRPSEVNIDELLRAVRACDFAAMILGADDLVKSRGKHQHAPRDNVVFELGMFMGGLDRARVFVLPDAGRHVKLPTDLDGFSVVPFVVSNAGAIDFGDGVARILAKIQELGPL